MNYRIDGSNVILNPGNVIGAGGEGTVFRTSIKGIRKAVKVYEFPTESRAAKLTSFISRSWRFPETVLAPEKLVYNAEGNVVGFTMPLLPVNAEEVRRLGSKKFRHQFDITTKEVAGIFLEGLRTLDLIHTKGIVVGDLNDLNTYSADGRMFFIDVDSWQFGIYPCPVATENFIDPLLYGTNLSLRPVFKPENDSYSFAVLLFKSLTLTHPFGGTHKSIKRLTERVRLKLPVYDKNVTYPGNALPVGILSRQLLEVFDRYFRQNWRGRFPLDLLANYYEALTQCTSCGLWFPESVAECPQCLEKLAVPVFVQRIVGSGLTVTAVELLRIQGNILTVKVQGNTISLIADENGKTVYYELGLNKPINAIELFKSIPGRRFEIFQGHIIVNPPGSQVLSIVKLTDPPSLLENTMTEIFSVNRKAVFRASGDTFFRIAGSTLLSGKIAAGRLIERPLRQIVAGQTWFTVDPENPNSVAGLYQVLRQQQYFLTSEKNNYELNIPQLEAEEGMVDVSIKFAKNTILLSRLTQKKGVSFVRLDEIDKKGQVIVSKRVALADRPSAEIHGQAYRQGVLLHPTDGGLVQEKLADGTLKTFPDASQYVNAGDSLIPYADGLLVVKTDRVLKLTINKNIP